MTELRDLGTVRLETARLILRQFTPEDAQGVFDGWTGDVACASRCTWKVHPNVHYTKEILSHWIDEYQDNAYNWVVELKDTYQLIGNISTVDIKRKHANCELGYCFGSRFWGQGYATEALRRIIDFLLKDCGFHLVEARHVASNPASGRVMQKAGMHLEAVLSERRYHAEQNRFEDVLIYSISLDSR